MTMQVGSTGKLVRCIALDLDGTAAHYDGWRGELHIGYPVESVRSRVLAALAQGIEVVIFTARMSHPSRVPGLCERVVANWTFKHYGQVLRVTGTKLIEFDEIWDDKAVGVACNTGVGFPPNRETLWEVLGRSAEGAMAGI